MSVNAEEIIEEIRKQEKIINEAQRVKEGLYQKLIESGTEGYDFISVKQAARILDVSLGTIYHKINRGELKTKHIGSSIRVSKSEILQIDDKYKSVNKQTYFA